MQKCYICEKPIYGHPTVPSDQKIVCGSCPLNKLQGTASGKSVFGVRIDLAKIVTQQIPAKQESVMSDLKVKSNVKNRVILLDGRIPLVFDSDGIGKLPAHLLPVLELEMRMKPGRFSVVSDVPVEVAPVLLEEVPAVESEVKVEEVLVPAAETLPPEVDQSFLAEEPVKPSKKASKKS